MDDGLFTLNQPYLEQMVVVVALQEYTNISYEFFWPFVSANLLQILKIDQPFDPNFDA
jgi:hypothetical protein